MNSLGRHILVEFYGCSQEILGDAARLEKLVVKAAKDAGATVLNSTFHQFSPVGTSGVVVIQESHLAIHTWPEFHYAAVDLFTCGTSIDPWDSFESLRIGLESSYASPLEMLRGQFGLLPKVEYDGEFEDETASINPAYKRNVWFTEWGKDSGLSLRHKGDKLVDHKSPFQKVEVYDTYKYGKMLTLDGLIMTTEKDEYVYHEMIAHPAMQAHKNAKRILIIGGGDGGVARELLRYKGVEEVIIAEVDEVVIKTAREHFPKIASSFAHPKAKLEIGDGMEYVGKSADESFDVVIVDSPDRVGPAEGLYSEEFYKNIHRILKPDGIMVAQSESPRFNEHVFIGIANCHRKLFGPENVWTYLAFVPTYTTGMWAFSFASKGNLNPSSVNPEDASSFSKENNLQYYNEDIHHAAFVLPTYVRNMLNP